MNVARLRGCLLSHGRDERDLGGSARGKADELGGLKVEPPLQSLESTGAEF